MGRTVNVFKKRRHLPHFPSVPPHHLQGTAVARNNPAWSEHMLGLIYIHRLQRWEHILVTGRTKLNWHLRYWAVTQAAEARADLQLPYHPCSKKLKYFKYFIHLLLFFSPRFLCSAFFSLLISSCIFFPSSVRQWAGQYNLSDWNVTRVRLWRPGPRTRCSPSGLHFSVFISIVSCAKSFAGLYEASRLLQC